jgi:quercetin dioxygenase-like cupin family protein
MPTPPLPSSVFDWNQLVAKPTPVGEFRAMTDGPTATFANFECHVTTLRPQQISHAPHRHPDEEIIVVKEGTLEVTVEGKSLRGGPGSLFFIASNDHHGLRNAGDTPAMYHVMRIVTR